MSNDNAATDTYDTENEERATLAADIIITCNDDILMIRRRWEPYTGYLALPGGLVDHNEEPHEAAARELKEETNVIIDPSQLRLVGVYTKPDRDPRGRVISWAYHVDLPNRPTTAQAGDDAAELHWISKTDLITENLAFDHGSIITDALARDEKAESEELHGACKKLLATGKFTDKTYSKVLGTTDRHQRAQQLIDLYSLMGKDLNKFELPVEVGITRTYHLAVDIIKNAN